MENKEHRDQEVILRAYRKAARRYDLVVDLFRLFGFRMNTWRRKAVTALDLRRGDSVVDVGCGTGLNFPYLQEAVGPEGSIVGVDLTDAMLEQARRRVTEHGWANVRLVQEDAAQFDFPSGLNGILSTFALVLVPECAQVIRHGCDALAPGGRWSVLDMCWPKAWPLHWARWMFWLRTLGDTDAVMQRRPWDTVWDTMQQELANPVRSTHMMEAIYLASGTRID